MTTDAAKRKQRNESYLKSLNVPVNSHLPLVEGERDVKLRTSEEVAKRCLILYVVVLVAHKTDRERMVAWLKNESLWESVSQSEKAFLEDSNPPQQAINAASWRAESLWTLLWSLGKAKELQLPKEMCDSTLIQEILPEPEESTAQFISQASLRPTTEILDATDLIYRIHWAEVDERLNNREPPGEFNPGIIYERHYALNWLTWYADDWDDITTDT